MCTCAKSLQSCLTLCNPMDCSPPGSSVHGVCSPAASWWKECSIQFLLMIFISQFFMAVYVHIGILNVCTHVHMQTHINKLHLYWKTKRILPSLWNVLAAVVEQDSLPLCENLWKIDFFFICWFQVGSENWRRVMWTHSLPEGLCVLMRETEMVEACGEGLLNH